MYINIWWRHSIAESTGQIPHVPTKIPRAKVATVYLGSSVCVYVYVHACIFIVFFFFHFKGLVLVTVSMFPHHLSVKYTIENDFKDIPSISNGPAACVCTHAANDLITTLVICGPWRFGASFHVHWLETHN